MKFGISVFVFLSVFVRARKTQCHHSDKKVAGEEISVVRRLLGAIATG